MSLGQSREVNSLKILRLVASICNKSCSFVCTISSIIHYTNVRPANFGLENRFIGPSVRKQSPFFLALLPRKQANKIKKFDRVTFLQTLFKTVF
mgnify:CR=1 FL=1